jgi:rare lipoprotein A
MRWVPILMLMAFAASGCASTKRVAQTGLASWYGPHFHGKKTANGEVYDQDRLTAAHKTLPFNTVVRVTNLDNGRQVTVRINDRGPYVQGRVIDLSRAAARQIRMIGPGTARVRIEILKAGGPIPDDLNRETFAVQVASFTNAEQARSRANELRGGWVQASRTDGQRVYRVMVGRYGNREQAEEALRDLKSRGVDGFVKQIQN